MSIIAPARSEAHGRLVPYIGAWPVVYYEEAQRLRAVCGTALLDIQHIGSTAVPKLSAKNIIDIGILVQGPEEADGLIEALQELGYSCDPAASSSERHFFRKYGGEQSFHLSLAYREQGGFWQRQLAFRDYLRAHPEEREAYEALKAGLISVDPSGGTEYLRGKTDFIERILKIASEN